VFVVLHEIDEEQVPEPIGMVQVVGVAEMVPVEGATNFTYIVSLTLPTEFETV